MSLGIVQSTLLFGEPREKRPVVNLPAGSTVSFEFHRMRFAVAVVTASNKRVTRYHLADSENGWRLMPMPQGGKR